MRLASGDHHSAASERPLATVSTMSVVLSSWYPAATDVRVSSSTRPAAVNTRARRMLTGTASSTRGQRPRAAAAAEAGVISPVGSTVAV